MSKSWIRVSLKIVSGRHPGRVEPAGSRVTDRSSRGVPRVPSSMQLPGRRPVRGEPPVEAHLQHHPAACDRGQRPVQVAKVRAAGFSQKTALPACRGRHDQIGVEAGRCGDHDRVDPRVGEHVRRHRCTPTRHPRWPPAAPPLPARVGHRDQLHTREPVGQRLAMERAHPTRPDQRHPHRPTTLAHRSSRPPSQPRTL